MNTEWIIESGIKRQAEQSICLHCKKEFLHRKNRVHKYCSVECSNGAKENKITVKCFSCGKDIERTASKLKNAKHGISFCSRECKEKEQRIEGGCNQIKPSHYGTGIRGIRDYKRLKNDRSFIENGCSCGEKRPYVLMVHHIDGNRDNNKQENLEVVCGTCHMLRHLKFVGGEWIHCNGVLTPRDKLSELINNNSYMETRSK